MFLFYPNYSIVTIVTIVVIVAIVVIVLIVVIRRSIIVDRASLNSICDRRQTFLFVNRRQSSSIDDDSVIQTAIVVRRSYSLIVVNRRQSSSIVVNRRQSSSIVVDRWWLRHSIWDRRQTFLFVNRRQSSSIVVDHRRSWLSSKFVDRRRSSIFVFIVVDVEMSIDDWRWSFDDVDIKNSNSTYLNEAKSSIKWISTGQLFVKIEIVSRRFIYARQASQWTTTPQNFRSCTWSIVKIRIESSRIADNNRIKRKTTINNQQSTTDRYSIIN